MSQINPPLEYTTTSLITTLILFPDIVSIHHVIVSRTSGGEPLVTTGPYARDGFLPGVHESMISQFLSCLSLISTVNIIANIFLLFLNVFSMHANDMSFKLISSDIFAT